MPNICEHIPSYCDGIEPSKYQFNTLEELLDTPLCKKWSSIEPHDYIQHGLRNENGKFVEFKEFRVCKDAFSFFALSDNHLMAILNNGKEWYVVGRIDNISGLDLPKWVRE